MDFRRFRIERKSRISIQKIEDLLTLKFLSSSNVSLSFHSPTHHPQSHPLLSTHWLQHPSKHCVPPVEWHPAPHLGTLRHPGLDKLDEDQADLWLSEVLEPKEDQPKHSYPKREGIDLYLLMNRNRRLECWCFYWERRDWSKVRGSGARRSRDIFCTHGNLAMSNQVDPQKMDRAQYRTMVTTRKKIRRDCG